MKKDFYKLLNNSFCGKIRENVRNRIKVELIRKDDEDKIIKQQSKVTFNGIHKSDTTYGSYTFKQKDFLIDNPNDSGFAALELSKVLMY